MSRLDSFIARMEAQRTLLNAISDQLNDAGVPVPGPIVEFGLGNGRTYDHLREKLPGRRIVVFERSPRPNERSRPPQQDLLIGEIQETARAFAATNGRTVALVHADLGDGSSAYEAELQHWLPDLCWMLLRPGGFAISSTKLSHPGLLSLALPPTVKPGRYFLYRAQ